jgi:hypothetical protein
VVWSDGHVLLSRPVFLSRRADGLRLCRFAALGYMTELAQRCAQDLALCCKPMAVGVSFLASALEPKMISAIADSLFDVPDFVSPKFASGASASPPSARKPAGVTPPLTPIDCRPHSSVPSVHCRRTSGLLVKGHADSFLAAPDDVTRCVCAVRLRDKIETIGDVVGVSNFKRRPPKWKCRRLSS